MLNSTLLHIPINLNSFTEMYKSLIVGNPPTPLRYYECVRSNSCIKSNYLLFKYNSNTLQLIANSYGKIPIILKQNILQKRRTIYIDEERHVRVINFVKLTYATIRESQIDILIINSRRFLDKHSSILAVRRRWFFFE